MIQYAGMKRSALKWLLTLFFLAGPLCAQQPKKIFKLPTPPAVGEYIIDPVVAESFGCIDDLVRMRSLTGVAQRKLAQDLIETSCIRPMQGIYDIEVNETHRLAVGKDREHRGFVFATVILDIAEMKEVHPELLRELEGKGISTTVEDIYVELKPSLTKGQFAEWKKAHMTSLVK